MTNRQRNFRLAAWSTLLVTALLAALAVVAQRPATGLALLVLVAAAAVGVLAPHVVAALKERREMADRQLQSVRELIVRWPLTCADAAASELGVSESKIASRYSAGGEQAPYVPREEDRRLRQALHEHSFVIVVGPSKAGKSRTALEALRSEEFRDRPLLVPRRPSDNPRALRDLIALDPQLTVGPQPALLWLDDLQEYLLAGALDVATLRRWREQEPRGAVVATLREGALADLRALESEGARGDGEPVAKAIGDVLDQAAQVFLEAKLTEQELELAKARYPG